jgi:hypothetical protein
MMNTVVPCEACIALVGAARTVEAHRKLVPVTKDSDRENVFQCDDCQCRWSVNLLGWARLVD